MKNLKKKADFFWMKKKAIINTSMNNIDPYPYQNLSLSDMEEEIWKEVFGYEGYLSVSNKGRVKSLARSYTNGRGFSFKEGRILKQKIGKDGLTFVISVDGIRYNHITARIVYSTFIKPLPDFKKKQLFILHKDNDNLNNNVDNLFLANRSQVMKHYFKSGIIKPNFHTHSEEAKKNFRTSRYKPVSQYTLEGKYLRTYKNIKEAAVHLGISPSSISVALQGKTGYAKGYLWREAKEEPSDIPPFIMPSLGTVISKYDKSGKHISDFESIRQAEKITGVNRNCIRKCLLGKRLTAGGYIWKEADKKTTEQ